jgi:ATP adenylyltransferase
MRYIPAPWREPYIRSGLAMKRCLFCEALRGRDDRTCRILHRGRHAFVLLNTYPYTCGHLMVAPRRHTADLAGAGPALTAEIMELVQRAVRILGRRYRPHGFNIGLNLGHAAGAGVADHFHVHVVCRYTGDASFMPLVSRTRVFLEDLDTTYDRLAPDFARARQRDARSGPARGGRPTRKPR